MLKSGALLLVGPCADNRIGLPEPLPPGVAVFEYASYAAVFPRASAIVHQGGVGTTAQALRAGIPSLIVPFNFDQPGNAARVARVGAACVVPRNAYTAKRAATMLRALVSDEQIIRRSRTSASEIASEHGSEAECDAIEQIL
jgi:rhamnosyltransferase subunit B